MQISPGKQLLAILQTYKSTCLQTGSEWNRLYYVRQQAILTSHPMTGCIGWEVSITADQLILTRDSFYFVADEKLELCSHQYYLRLMADIRQSLYIQLNTCAMSDDGQQSQAKEFLGI